MPSFPSCQCNFSSNTGREIAAASTKKAQNTCLKNARAAAPTAFVIGSPALGPALPLSSTEHNRLHCVSAHRNHSQNVLISIFQSKLAYLLQPGNRHVHLPAVPYATLKPQQASISLEMEIVADSSLGTVVEVFVVSGSKSDCSPAYVCALGSP